MIYYLDYAALLKFLEESFGDKKNEIKSLNKYFRDGKSFLCCTYDVRQVSVKNDIVKYMVIIFQDLPSPYPDLILEKIRSYLDDNELEFEYITWEKYKTYNNTNQMF